MPDINSLYPFLTQNVWINAPEMIKYFIKLFNLDTDKPLTYVMLKKTIHQIDIVKFQLFG